MESVASSQQRSLHFLWEARLASQPQKPCLRLRADLRAVLSSSDGLIAAPGAGGGSSGAAEAEVKAPGMRLCLSQIREWVVEYSADTLFISMRTNVAWYRLTTCASNTSST